MRKIFTTVLLLFTALIVSAQNDEVGLFGGSSFYNGDINPINHFRLSKPQAAYGLFYRHNFDSRLAMKISYTQGTLKDDDISSNFQPVRDIYFTTKINELSAQFEVNFFDFNLDGENNRITPYVFGGVGITAINVVNLRNVVIPGLADPKYGDNTTIASFPIGVGIKYCPVSNMTIGLEWGIRKSNSSRLDGVYTDPYRASAENDWYSFAGFSISYNLNFLKPERCY